MEASSGALNFAFFCVLRLWGFVLGTYKWRFSDIKAILWVNEWIFWTIRPQSKQRLCVKRRTLTSVRWVSMVKHPSFTEVLWLNTFITWLFYGKLVFSHVEGCGCFACASCLWEWDRLKSSESLQGAMHLSDIRLPSVNSDLPKLHLINSEAPDYMVSYCSLDDLGQISQEHICLQGSRCITFLLLLLPDLRSLVNFRFSVNTFKVL